MNLNEITNKLKSIFEIYKEKYSLNLNEDYFLIKIQEELGELSSAHLKLTNRGRAESIEKHELEKNLREEIEDVISMTLLFDEVKNINIEDALNEKWFKYLKKS